MNLINQLLFRWTSSFDDSAFNDQVFKENNSQQISSQDPFSDGKSRYSGLDFHEDPFKNNNYRYADPFAENSDPVSYTHLTLPTILLV